MKLLILFALALCSYTPHAAAESVSIAAVVNQQPITSQELAQRIKLALLASGLTSSPDNVKLLKPSVLQTLIDEKLQLQVAQQNNIQPSQQQIAGALSQLAAQNNLSPEQLVEALEKRGVPPHRLQQQVVASLSWSQLIQRAGSQSVSISEARLQNAVERALRNSQHDQYDVSIITLHKSPNSQPIESLQSLAQNIREQRASFQRAATQISQDPSALDGGRLGPLPLSLMSPPVADAVKSLKPGEVSNPVNDGNSVHLLMLNSFIPKGTRNPLDDVVSFLPTSIPLPSSPPNHVIEAAAKTLTDLNSIIASAPCPQAEEILTRAGAAVQSLQSARVRELPESVQAVLLQSASPPVLPPRKTSAGVETIVVCERRRSEGHDADPDALRRRLYQQDLAQFAQQTMRRLRAEASIDIRTKNP